MAWAGGGVGRQPSEPQEGDLRAPRGLWAPYFRQINRVFSLSISAFVLFVILAPAPIVCQYRHPTNISGRHLTKKTQNFQVNKLLSSQRGQPVPQYALFDLSKDPAEKNNVADENPKVFERMKSELQKFLDDGRSR